MTSQVAARRTSSWANNESLLIGVGMLIIYLVWGSMYVAIRYVVTDVPALLSIGGRYVVAGALIAAFVIARHGLGAFRMGRAELLGCLGLAVLLQVLTNGTVTLAESVGVQAGPAALLSALAPVVIVCLRAWTNDRPHTITWIGVATGFGGLAVLLLGGRSVPGFPLIPSVLIVLSACCWAVGSFLQPRLRLPGNTFVTTSMQLLVGGLLLTLSGLVGGERTDLSFSLSTWLVMAYMTVASVVAYSSYVWLLAHAPISLVSTHAYINPIVAVALGWLWLGEPITWPVVLGGLIVLVAVALVMIERKPLPAEPPNDL